MFAIFTACPNINHLEVNRCELTELSLKGFVKDLPKLKFLDLSGVQGVTLPLIEEIQQKKPELLLR